MFVSEVMNQPAITLSADDSVRYAAQLLLRHRIASAPVVDADGGLVGIVSEADLIRSRLHQDPRAFLLTHDEAADPDEEGPYVADVMAASVVSVQARGDASDAARLLMDSGVRALPVVQGHRVVGVVARRDLLRSLARPDEDVAHDIRQLLDELEYGGGVDIDVEDGVVSLRGAKTASAQRIATVLARTVPGVVRVLTAADFSLDAPGHRRR